MEVPPEVLAAVAAGKEEEVKLLLEKAPEGMSKSTKKKLIKTAFENAKKLAKGGAVAAPKPPPASAPNKPTTPAAAATAKKPAAAAPPAAPARTGAGAGSAERELVADLLACIETLALPADALASLRANEETLALSLAKTVNGLRNDAYTSGFLAHGSRLTDT